MNCLLVELTQHSFAISINMLSLPSPSFANDITLLATYPTFLSTWVLGNETVDERYEYKNLAVVKNYIGSFSSNIDKTRKYAGMIFASGFDRRKVNPFVYINPSGGGGVETPPSIF